MEAEDNKILRLAGREFRCIPKMPAGLLLDLSGGSSDPGGRVWQRFLDTLIVEDERDDLREWLYSPDGPEWADFQSAMNVLMGEYLQRPTQRPSRSPVGGTPTEPLRRVVSLSPVQSAETKKSPRAGTRAG